MKYLVAPTSGFQIVHRNTSLVSELTIKLGLVKPEIIISNSTYIGGVYDLSSSKKNPGLPYCEIDEKQPTITDDWISVSANTKNQLTLNLITNLKQL